MADEVVEGEHEYLAVRSKAFPHDVRSIRREDFDPERFEIARPHRAAAAAVRFTAEPAAAVVEE